MILFAFLLSVLLIFGICAIFVIGIGGMAFILVFGDVIICIGLIIIIIKHIIKRKK